MRWGRVSLRVAGQGGDRWMVVVGENIRVAEGKGQAYPKNHASGKYYPKGENLGEDVNP